MHKVEIWQICKCDGVKAKIGIKTNLDWLPKIGDSFVYQPIKGAIQTISHEYIEDKYVHIFHLAPQKINLPIDAVKPPVIIKINF